MEKFSLLECERFRIEVKSKLDGKYYVTIQPVRWLGKEIFKLWLNLCRRNFMNLTGYWMMERAFNSRAEAEAFARYMAEKLEEPAFLYIGEVKLTHPVEQAGRHLNR